MDLCWRGDSAHTSTSRPPPLLLTQASQDGAPGADAAGADPQLVLVCRNFKVKMKFKPPPPCPSAHRSY